jgi:chromosome segregation ATPase
MAGIDEAFWDQLDARIAATFSRAPRRRRPQSTSNRGRVPRSAQPDEAAQANPQQERHQVSDWTELVDTIAAAGTAAQEQHSLLRARNAAYDALAADLKQALDDVERYKALVAQAQAQVEVKTKEIRALAEARIEAIQARADARVRRAEERAQSADRRAGAVEDWLAEIDAASRELLPAAPRMPVAKAS